MKQTLICEWIYRKNKDNKKGIYALRIPQHINESFKFDKGNYLVKIYKLESEVKH